MSATLELAGQLHVSDRTLRRAVTRGLLRGSRRSPNRLEISAAERRYAQSHWTLLQALVRALRTEPGVRVAVLYGSVAKGSDRTGSDIDLAVELRRGPSASMPALERRLGQAVGRRVHTIRMADALADGCFALEIVDHGRPLVDRADAWSLLRRRRSSLARLGARQAAERERQLAAAWTRLVREGRMSKAPSERQPPEQPLSSDEQESDRARLERKILSHVQTLLTRQLPDLTYAKERFAVYDRKSFQKSFQKSFDASTPSERDLANRVVGAFDDAVNGLNEILRNAYCLEHGYRRVGPAMPVVYAGLPLAHASELEWINDTRNDLTHDYPVAEANRIFDVVHELDRIIVRTLRDIHAFATEHGLSIPGIKE